MRTPYVCIGLWVIAYCLLVIDYGCVGEVANWLLVIGYWFIGYRLYIMGLLMYVFTGLWLCRCVGIFVTGGCLCVVEVL